MKTIFAPTPAMIAVTIYTSYYMTFDGRRCHCKVPVCCYSKERLYLEVVYEDGILEKYLLTSNDAFRYFGTKQGEIDDGRVYFSLMTHEDWILLAGHWMCGGRQGEWYINGKTA